MQKPLTEQHFSMHKTMDSREDLMHSYRQKQQGQRWMQTHSGITPYMET